MLGYVVQVGFAAIELHLYPLLGGWEAGRLRVSIARVVVVAQHQC